MPTLDQCLEDFFQDYLQLNPIMATYIGVHTWDDRFQNIYSYEHQAKTQQLFQRYQHELSQIKTITQRDRLNLLAFQSYATYKLRELNLPFIQLPMNHMDNIFLDLVELVVGDGLQALGTPDDLDRFRHRMKEFSESIPSLLARLREGAESGIVIPRVITEMVIEGLVQVQQTRPYLKASSDPHYRETMELYYLPNLQSCLQYLQEYYLPLSRPELGLSHLPNNVGAKMYQYLTNSYTTRDNLDADTIHQIGLGEVERILQEADQVRKTLPIAEFEDNPKFYPKSKQGALDMYRKIKRQIAKEVLPKFFGQLRPKVDYDIKPVPKYREKSAPAAYYHQPSLDGTRKGAFFVNLGNLKEHPIYNAEALCLHEGNPGHHFQLALSQEYDIPNFRRFGEWISYVEGWGLYTESLGTYRDKYSIMGRYEYELLRASRLVVDTGIHHLGWSYQRAFRFMKGIFPSMEVSEIDRCIYRYVAIPGQALAYKIGELAIQSLRRTVLDRAGLGTVSRHQSTERTRAIQKFHRDLLEMGPVPLNLMEKYMLGDV